MARLPLVDPERAAPEVAEALRALPAPLGIFRLMAHAPTCLRPLVALGTAILGRQQLDPRLRELAILMVGYLTRAPYEWSHHVEIGRKFGVSDADIRALMDEAEGRASALEPLAKAVLQAAREMTGNLAIADATFARLREGLDEESIVDLTLTIAFYNGVVRTLASLQIDVEDDYKRYLDEFPLPAGDQGKA